MLLKSLCSMYALAEAGRTTTKSKGDALMHLLT